VARNSTAVLLDTFRRSVSRDPSPILEHVRQALAHGGDPARLAEQWNAGDPELLIAAGLQRDAAVRVMVDRMTCRLIERDGLAHPELRDQARSLFGRAMASHRSLPRVVEDLARRSAAVLALASPRYLAAERAAESRLSEICPPMRETGSGYIRTQNRVLCTPAPEKVAENRHRKSSLAELREKVRPADLTIPAFLRRTTDEPREAA
jgi:hypothetical protein